MSLSSTLMTDVVDRRWQPGLVVALALLFAAAVVGVISGTGQIDPATTVYP